MKFLEEHLYLGIVIMNKLKVVKINTNEIVFDGGVTLSSDHHQNCCEHHELCLGDLTMSDFDGLEFNLADDSFFKRIANYGIELIPIHGHSVKIAGHGYNNGYYTDNLELVITNGKDRKIFDITECQDIDE